jgi:hypothetical protein
MDRQQMERCLERVAAYRASGQTAKVWAEANDVPMRSIASWCAHSRRWQARLDGVVSTGPSAAPRPSGFVAARVAPSAASAAVRVELNAAAVRLELHWPLAHTRELAALLRELSQ